MKNTQLYYTIEPENKVEVLTEIGMDNVLKISNEQSEFIPQQVISNNKVKLTIDGTNLKSGFYTIKNNQNNIKTIAFNAVENDLGAYLLKNNNKIFNIAGKLSLNEWKGQSNVEFIIDDISVNKTLKNTVPSSIG